MSFLQNDKTAQAAFQGMDRNPSVGGLPAKWARLAGLMLLAGWMAAGCNLLPWFDDDGGGGQATRFEAELQYFGTNVLTGYSQCSQLSGDLVKAGQLIANGVIQEGVLWGDGGVAVSADDTSGGAPEDGEAGSGSEGYGTNVQVSGVDEADVVKSDGTWIFLSFGSELVVLDQAGTEIDRKTAFPEMGIASLMLAGGRLLAISTARWIYDEMGFDESANSSMVLYEVGADGLLTELERTELAGSFMEGRSMGTQAYVINAVSLDNYSYLVYPLSRYHPDFEGMSDSRYEAAAFAKAQLLVPDWEEHVMEQLFGADTANASQLECKNVMQISLLREGDDGKSETETYFLNGGVASTFLQVSSFDMAAGFSGSKLAGVFSPSDYYYGLNVYADQEVLVLGNNGWRLGSNQEWYNNTMFFLFTYQDGAAVPHAVGTVDGSLLNQYAMDYHEGYLRVATTVDSVWSYDEDLGWNIVADSESKVSTLAVVDQQLTLVGQVGGLGQGERLYAVRFMGDRGFVVTFMQTDPFYTLDLSDPANPAEMGELEIPGFSNYLHPVGTDRILGVGQYADPETGWAAGMQVSLFDVSDLSNPVRLSNYVDEGWSYSSAQWDFHAFRFLESSGTLILPVSGDFGGSQSGAYSYFDGFEIFTVTDTTISLQGRIEHPQPTYEFQGCGYYAYLKPRSMVFSDTVITMKSSSVLAHDLPTLGDPLWTVTLDTGSQQDNAADCPMYY